MLSNILPKRLHKGDQVALIAPSFQATEEQINKAVERLQALGLKVINTIGSYKNDGYFAASTEETVNQIHQAFADQEIKALISVRGGYGCARLLPFLDWDLIKVNPKIIMGFSDVTSLLIAIYERTGLFTFHGPSASIVWSEATHHSVQQTLFAHSPVCFGPDNDSICIRGGQATGEIIGGNLSVFSSLIGSTYMPKNWQNKILFLEDVNEEIYKLDRLLTQLKLAGILTQVKGLIFGRFNNCTTKVSNSFSLIELLQRVAHELNIPVLAHMNFGHQPEMFVFPIGATAHLNADQKYLELPNFILP